MLCGVWLIFLLAVETTQAQDFQEGDPSSASPGFLGSFEGHKAGIYALAVSDFLVASGSKDGSIRAWNLTRPALRAAEAAPRRPLKEWTAHRAGVTALALGPGHVVSGGADNVTQLWSLATGELLRELPHPKTVFGLSISGDRLLSACWDGRLRVFDLAEGRLVQELAGHQGGLYDVSHSPLDPTLVATASADRIM